MLAGRARGWTCSAVAGCPGGHAHSWRWAMDLLSGSGLPRGTCPIFAAARGYLGIMLTGLTGRWTCPPGRGQTIRCPDFVAGYKCGPHAHPCAQRWACPTVAGCPGGHAQSWPQREDTWASCPLPAVSDGHAPRLLASQEDMLTPDAELWTCPAVPAAREDMLNLGCCQRTPGPHVLFPRSAMDMPHGWGLPGRTCSLLTLSFGPAQRVLAARADMSTPAAEGWACPAAAWRLVP
jgi:hypothetical protein